LTEAHPTFVSRKLAAPGNGWVIDALWLDHPTVQLVGISDSKRHANAWISERSDVWPANGEYPLAKVGSGNTPRFAIFAAGSSKVSALAIKFPDLIDAEIRSPLDPDVILLVRPDGYVACAAQADDVGVIGDYLGAIDVVKALAA
jgi:hypothetical protein